MKRCKEAKIESVYDIMEMEDDDRNALLQMDARQMRDVAAFVNSYPTLDVSHELVKGEYTAGAPIYLKVNLSKDVDEDEAERKAKKKARKAEKAAAAAAAAAGEADGAESTKKKRRKSEA